MLNGPEYNPRTREYVFPGGRAVPEYEYLQEQRYWFEKSEERRRKMDAEYRLKCTQATAVLEEYLNGTPPSMVHSRLKARRIIW